MTCVCVHNRQAASVREAPILNIRLTSVLFITGSWQCYSSGPVNNESFPTIEPREYIWWPSTAQLLSAERAVLIKKKESSSVKLKAFRHT